MIGLVVSTFAEPPTPFDVFLAAYVGSLIGAVVLVLAGAPTRRPTMQAVLDGLAAVGVDVRHLERAGVDARGSTPYFGVEADGLEDLREGPRHGRTQRRLAVPLYRWLLRRDFGDQAVRVLAAHGGARSARRAPLAAGAMRGAHADVTSDRDGRAQRVGPRAEAIKGKSLDRVDPSDVTDDVLAAIWQLVGELRRHRFAHRDLRLANIFLDDGGQVWLIDFGFRELVASDLLLATDVAELLASSSLSVGSEHRRRPSGPRRRPTDLVPGAGPAPAVGAERGDAHGDQGSCGPAR